MSHFRLSLILLLAFLASNSVFANNSKTDSTELASPANEPRTPLNYEGWAVLKRKVLDPSASDDEWVSMRDITVTDDGKLLRIMDGDKSTPYSLELIIITYEKSNTTVLKLALYEEGNDKSVTYIWGAPGAERLGMNLRWMQAGFTLKN